MTSTISWLRGEDGSAGESWNPIRAKNTKTGRLGHHCEHVHEGCRFCYAGDLNRNPRNLPHGGTGLEFKPAHLDAGDVEVFLDEERLLAPLSWRKPKRIFVESMSDPYGRWVKQGWLDRIKAVQASTPQHTYIELTKRPEAQRDYLRDPGWYARAAFHLPGFGRPLQATAEGLEASAAVAQRLTELQAVGAGLPNVIGGPSCSYQRDIDAFGAIALEAPLAWRVISLEPLLAPVSIRGLALGFDGGDPGRCACDHMHGFTRCPNTGSVAWRCHVRGCGCENFRRPPGPGLHLVIIGFESGADGRPGNVAWIRDLIAQCRAVGVLCFIKQLGRRPYEFAVDKRRRKATVAKERPIRLRDRKGEDPAEWPADLRVRQFPAMAPAAIAAPADAQRDLFAGATA